MSLKGITVRNRLLKVIKQEERISVKELHTSHFSLMTYRNLRYHIAILVESKAIKRIENLAKMSLPQYTINKE